MKNILFLPLLLFSAIVFGQPNEEAQIRELLETQTKEWNKGNIEGFMQTYWKSDSLMFIGKNGIKWGWQETLNNYRKTYPDAAAMGQLSFDILVVKKLSP